MVFFKLILAQTSLLSIMIASTFCSSLVQAGDQQKRDGSHSVYILDSTVKDIEYLSKTITQPIYIIKSTQSVVSQLSDIAKAHPNANEWHIISHGQAGELQLGNERWNDSWLEQADLGHLLVTLPKNSHWYLYACDLAKGEEGQAFVDGLARAINVAISASINKTGVVNGADTVLEYHFSTNTDHKIISPSNGQVYFEDYRYALSRTILEWTPGCTALDSQIPQESGGLMASIIKVIGVASTGNFINSVEAPDTPIIKEQPFFTSDEQSLFLSSGLGIPEIHYFT